ncbi:MAG: hypothetical protein AAGJ82_14195 [Bacteroidota bacterium]
MKHPRSYLLITAIVSFAATLTQAQVTVNIGLDTSVVLIGDQLGVSVDISAPAGTAIRAVEYRDWVESGEAELGQVSPLNTITAQPLLLQQNAQIQVFDSGYHRFEPLAVVYELNGRVDTAYSGDLGLEVVTLAVPDEAPIRENKDNIFERVNWRDALPYAIGAVVLALLVFLLRRQSQQVKVVPEAPPPPPVPAHVTALEKLDQLEQAAIWQRGEIKAFQSELTYVLREYLENRYDIPALEATTPEITQALRTTDLATTQQEQLRQILAQADMVKFAKSIPPVEAHPQALTQVRTFVEDTQLIEQKPEENLPEVDNQNDV